MWHHLFCPLPLHYGKYEEMILAWKKDKYTSILFTLSLVVLQLIFGSGVEEDLSVLYGERKLKL